MWSPKFPRDQRDEEKKQNEQQPSNHHNNVELHIDESTTKQL